MEKIKKINTVLVIFVILGTIFANINAIVSIIPNSNLKRNDNKTDNNIVAQNIREFDITTINEIASYIQTQSEINKFEISTIVYSAGLLFESDDTLIIIGHGFFDSKNQYHIGDYSANRINRITDDKEIVALLSCYSSNIKLENKKSLTYNDKIDIVSAINDLFALLDWTKTFEYLPENNISLFDLDPGGGNGPAGAPDYSNGLMYAHTVDSDYGHLYWNLEYESGVVGLGNYMMSHKYRLIEITIVNSYYVEIAPNTYQMYTNSLEFNTWVLVEGDMKDYCRIQDIVIDGDSESGKHTIKIEDLYQTLSNDYVLQNYYMTFAVALVTTLVSVGVAMLAVGARYTAIAATYAAASGAIYLVNLGWTYIAAGTLGTVCTLVGVVLIVLAVIAILAVLIIGLT